MADPTVDTAPTTSYSDPIYDRLEALSHRVRRARWAIIAAIVAAVALGLGLRAYFNHRPEASSAVAFIKANDEADAGKRSAALQALVGDEAATPFFRAKAALELCQEALTAGKPADAKGWAAKASAAAAQAQDDELSLAARLSEAAVAEDAGELDAAFAHYEAVQGKAGSKFVNHYLLAVYGAARIEKGQGKAKAALERLDPVVTRSDDAARPLLPLLQSLYWACKREVDGGPTTTAAPVKPADPAAALLPATIPSVQPAAPAAPAQPVVEQPAPAPAVAPEAPAAPAAK